MKATTQSLRHFGYWIYLFTATSIKKYGFIALRTKLFVLSHYRNRRYGNEHYDKTYRYEIF